MARDRQRSKARQQQRREQRLAQRRDAAALGEPPSDAAGDAGADDLDHLEVADLEVGAPPEDIGRSDRTLRDEPPPPSFDTDDETLGEDGNGAIAGPRGVRGESREAESHQRGRVIAFLVAVWAELKRVQWPDRRQLMQLTGVVLFFVLIVGAYLGALDAVAQKIINAIL